MNNSTIFLSPEQVIFGIGVVQQVSNFMLELSGGKVFVVTDKVVQNLDNFNNIIENLKNNKFEYYIYFDVDANPTDIQIENGAEVFRIENADSLIAVGGGSTIDTAKSIGILINNGGSIRDYDFDHLENPKTINNHIPPLITIPTTSGTGSEVSAWAVVTNTNECCKFSPGGPKVLPKIALVDPKMTESMPPLTTACTGIDALSHAIEAIVSPYSMSQTDAFAYSAIRSIVANIGPAVANGSNISAREGMSIGALEAGLSMNALCGGIHALGHQLSTQFDIPHGMAMGIMMPVVVNFNLIACPEKFANIAYALGERIEGLSIVEAAEKVPTVIKKIVSSIGLPTNLKDCCIEKSLLTECAKRSIKDASTQGNPRTISLAQAEALFLNAYEN